MRILIAGGAGFIGSHLIERFLEQGHEVIAVDNLTTGYYENISPHLSNPRFRFFELSIESEIARKEMEQFPKIDQVYDLACPTGVPNCRTLAEEMIDACSMGVKNLLRISLSHDASFLITSSSEIYGDPLEFPQTEEYTGNVNPTSERSAYEEGKRFAETVTMMYVRKYAAKARIARLFNVYGPRMSLSDTRVVPRLATQALRGETMTIHNGGEQTRTFCFISDMAAGLELAMNAGHIGEVYNIGGSEEVAIKDLAVKIRTMVNSSSPIEHYQPPMRDHNRRQPSLAKIHALGWAARVAFDDGLNATIADFRKRLGM